MKFLGFYLLVLCGLCATVMADNAPPKQIEVSLVVCFGKNFYVCISFSTLRTPKFPPTLLVVPRMVMVSMWMSAKTYGRVIMANIPLMPQADTLSIWVDHMATVVRIIVMVVCTGTDGSDWNRWRAISKKY